MRHIKLFNESNIVGLTIEDLDTIDDLFLSVADSFNMIQVDFPTPNYIFNNEEEIIYRVHTKFWNGNKSTTLIDDCWDCNISDVTIRVVGLGWFESLYDHPNPKTAPDDVLDLYGDLISELEKFRSRLLKFNYNVGPIKYDTDYYGEMQHGEEISSPGISMSISINSKLVQ